MNEQPKTEAPRQVYTAIRRVMEDMARSGVGKTKTNAQQNFAYRGVDDVMDALAPSLSKHGLIIVPHVTERITTERASRSGGTLFHTLLRIDYDFISVEDGSQQHVGPIYGEAMDSGDKATNKAMAIAYKYACVQTFCIPITGDDPDAQSHELADAQAQKEPARSPQQRAPAVPRPPESARSASVLKQPEVMRPSGNFGYGRKFRDIPWSLMYTRDLEWFLNAERTPQPTRDDILAEMAWREYDEARLSAQVAREKAAEEANPLSDDIP